MKMKRETILPFQMKFHYLSRRLKSLFNNLKLKVYLDWLCSRTCNRTTFVKANMQGFKNDKKVLRLPNAIFSRIFLLFRLNIRKIKNVKSHCYKNVYCYQEVFINIFLGLSSEARYPKLKCQPVGFVYPKR